jgi:hypothetical protein
VAYAKKAGSGEKAVVSVVEGTAEKSAKKTGPWTGLKQGSELAADDYLKTGEDSRVELNFSDGTKLRVDQNSLVKMKSLMVGGGGKKQFDMHLQTGKVWAKVKKAVGGEETFKVTTENAVAGVRGTIFRVDYRSDKATVVRVYSGSVAVRNMPVYAKPEAVKDPSKRVQVQGPQQITKQQWEELIAKEMQQISVGADGAMSAAEEFTNDSESGDKWVQWNKKLDEAAKE